MTTYTIEARSFKIKVFPLKLMKTSRLFFAMLASFSLLSACSNTPKPPLSFPFAVQKAGSKIETDFYITEKRYYSFSLDFGFKEKDRADRWRVKELVGSYRIDRFGKLIEPGIPIPLRLIIKQINPTWERTIYEEEMSEQRLWAWGSGHFTKLIEGEILTPGHYRVSVETLKDIPELIGTPVTFNIAFGHSK